MPDLTPETLARLREVAREAAVVASASAMAGRVWPLDGIPAEVVKHFAASDPPTVLALIDALEAERAKVAAMEVLATAAEERGHLSLARTGEGGTFGAWVTAAEIRAALGASGGGA